MSDTASTRPTRDRDELALLERIIACASRGDHAALVWVSEHAEAVASFLIELAVQRREREKSK